MVVVLGARDGDVSLGTREKMEVVGMDRRMWTSAIFKPAAPQSVERGML
jgi:hypothetical protein